MRGIFVRYFILLACLFIFLGCSKTPIDAPIDSYRDVEINVDMNKAIADGLFDVNNHALILLIDSVNEYVMSDENGDQIFSITISNLIFGKTYEYQYAVNETLEILEGDRTFTVYDDKNVLSDYYGELNPTILIFLVNMSYQIELGNFDSNADFLDVAGTFNNWEGTDFHLVAIENNVYTITITDIEAGDEIEFKFRINGETWENPNPEVSNCVIDSDGYINRAHTVEQGENSLEYWFNDENGK
jgi:hypothetical protein